MNCIQCDACLKWYHADCAPNMEYSFETYVEKKFLYFCNIKCELTFLPFNSVKKNESIDEFNPTSEEEDYNFTQLTILYLLLFYILRKTKRW